MTKDFRSTSSSITNGFLDQNQRIQVLQPTFQEAAQKLSSSQTKKPLMLMGEELQVLSASEMLADLARACLRSQYGPDISKFLDIKCKYNQEEDYYEMNFDIFEGTEEDIEKAKLAVTDYLKKLEPFADPKISIVSPEVGQILIDSKMDMLDLLTDQLQATGVKLYDLETDHALLPDNAGNPSDLFGEAIRSFSAKAKNGILQNESYPEILLLMAHVRFYNSEDAYLASCQCVLENSDFDFMFFSNMIRVLEEKIKLEDRTHPGYEKGSVHPSYFLN